MEINIVVFLPMGESSTQGGGDAGPVVFAAKYA
jgi:hypothetical protein